eukprot:PhF_6_TR6168/c2_g1_i1/m.9197
MLNGTRQIGSIQLMLGLLTISLLGGPRYALATARTDLKNCEGVTAYEKKSCYEKVLETDPHNAIAWNNLGENGGGTVLGVMYDEKMCYAKALEIDLKYSHAWINLAIVGGGTVLGFLYDKKTCYIKALEIDSNYSHAWNNLGN